MKNDKDKSEKKRCSGCRKIFPKTPEFFYWKKHSRRKQPFPESRCKPCSKAYGKAYKQENQKKLSVIARKYNHSPKGIYRRLGKFHHGWKVTITQREFLEWYELQPQKCFYCGITVEDMKRIPDKFNNRVFRLTIDRIDSLKGYDKGNLVLCCLRCNQIKNDFFSQSEMVKIGKMFIKPKWKKYAQA